MENNVQTPCNKGILAYLDFIKDSFDIQDEDVMSIFPPEM